MKLKKFFLWSLVFSLVVSGLLAIVIFLFADFDERDVKILFTTLDIGACSLAGLCCSTILATRLRIFGALGIIISVLCMLDLTYIIWANSRNDDDFDMVLSLVILTATCSHISLIMLTQTSTSLVTSILAATVIFIAIVGGMLLGIVWHTDRSEFYYRLLGVFAILDVLGTIITPILGKTQKFEDALE